MIDRGTGFPVVLIPGVQGRWEWMSPAVDALASRCRVITFSLADERASGVSFDPAMGFDSYVLQVRDALDRLALKEAAVIGVSFGGLIAAEFAARFPHRAGAVILASALPPGWTPDARARFYMRAPTLLSPLFFVRSPMRMMPELRAALPLGARLRFLLSLTYRSLRYPLSPSRMARRVRWTETFAFAEPSHISAPTLVVTGEDHLDRIVAPALSRRYAELVPQARVETLAHTGHIGLVTRPEAFANLVCGFIDEIAQDAKRISA